VHVLRCQLVAHALQHQAWFQNKIHQTCLE
jgi:hypothetical protein